MRSDQVSPRKRTSRVYWRDQGGARRAYGDFRDYRDVGGKLEPLVAQGEKRATTASRSTGCRRGRPPSRRLRANI
jgi:hypothetical protein